MEKEFVSLLLKVGDQISADELSIFVKYYDWFYKKYGIILCIDDNDQLYKQLNEIKECWVNIKYFKDLNYPNHIFYSEQERQYIIYLMCFLDQENLSVYHFQDLLKVSKNTVLSDIKKLRTILANADIQLKYSRKKGFFLEGKEKDIRIYALYFLDNLFSIDHGEQLLYRLFWYYDPLIYYQVSDFFLNVINDSNIYLVKDQINYINFIFTCILFRSLQHPLDFLSDSDKVFISSLSITKSFFSSLVEPVCFCSEWEIYYLIVIFMALLPGYHHGQDPSLEFLLLCAQEMVYEFERLGALEFNKYRNLLLDTFYHLIPAYFRIQYGFKIKNVLLAQIKENYEEIYVLTQLSMSPLKKITGKYITDDEVGYFTILFGGYMKTSIQTSIEVKKFNALIVCPNSVSASSIMKFELEKIFPQISFKSMSIKELTENHSQDFDMIFSSVPLVLDRLNYEPIYVIDPIMTVEDRHHLFYEVSKDFNIFQDFNFSVVNILDAILPYVNIKEGYNRDKILKKVYKRLNIIYDIKEDTRPLLSELITEDMILFSDKELSWEDAIALSADPLLETNKISSSYIEAMIQKVNDYGPFIHIGSNIALPHARPEDGVNELGMSLLKVNHPVYLLDDPNHEIKIFICLAAVDNEMHLRALSSLTKILSNKSNLDELLSATTKEEILNIISREEDE